MAFPPSLLWPLLLMISLRAECSERSPNPKVIRLTFRNDTEPSVNLPDRLLSRPAAAHSGLPVVYCRHSEYPADVDCDVASLLEQDVFPADMNIFGATTAVPDPVRDGKVCILEFENSDEEIVKPLSFKEIECGREREITSQDSLVSPVGVESMAVLPQFKVANMIDVVLNSYSSGFGCLHRLKRHFGNTKRTRKRDRGSLFKLDSFYCTIGFGVAEGRPNTTYPPQMLYKYNGRRWRPVGIWPDYMT